MKWIVWKLFYAWVLIFEWRRIFIFKILFCGYFNKYIRLYIYVYWETRSIFEFNGRWLALLNETIRAHYSEVRVLTENLFSWPDARSNCQKKSKDSMRLGFDSPSQCSPLLKSRQTFKLRFSYIYLCGSYIYELITHIHNDRYQIWGKGIYFYGNDYDFSGIILCWEKKNS